MSVKSVLLESFADLVKLIDSASVLASQRTPDLSAHNHTPMGRVLRDFIPCMASAAGLPASMLRPGNYGDKPTVISLHGPGAKAFRRAHCNKLRQLSGEAVIC